MRAKTLFCLFAFFLVSFSWQQAFSQAVVNSTGNTLQNPNLSVEYSIGEISIATLPGDQISLTQGLLQPIIFFRDCDFLHFIPNAFTPNKDRLNDCFGVKNWPAVAAFELCVYNRWGEQVFKTNSLSECWNGEYKGQPQPVGTYVYTIKAQTAACGAVANKGTITLIR